MQGLHVYPTAPAGFQQPQDGLNLDAAHHPLEVGADHAESPGKTPKSPIGKVKDKARKLKDKIKKVTGSSSPTTNDHGNVNNEHGNVNNEHGIDRGHHGAFAPPPPQYDDVDGDTYSHEEDDDEVDHVPVRDKQAKNEQVRSMGVMDSPGDGSEVEVHGGVPASTLAAKPGTYNPNAQASTAELPDDAPIRNLHDSAGTRDNDPISPYKSPGPPGTLQAAPTEYHYTPENDDQVFKGQENDSLPEVKASGLQDDMSYPSYSSALNDVPRTLHKYVPSPDAVDDQEKPKPSGDVPTSPYHDNAPSKPSPSQDLPYTTREGAEDSSLEAMSRGLPPSVDVKRTAGSSSPLSSGMVSPSQPPPSESPRKDMNVAYPDDIVKPNPEFGHSSSPMHNKIAVINEELPAEARLDVGLTPTGDYGSQQSPLDKALPENAPLILEGEELGDKDSSTAVAGSWSPSPDVEKASTDVGGRFYGSQQSPLHKASPENAPLIFEGEELGDKDSSTAFAGSGSPFPDQEKASADVGGRFYDSQQSPLDKALPENAPLLFEGEEVGDKDSSTAVAGSGSPSPDEGKASTDMGGRFDGNVKGLEPFFEAKSGGSLGREDAPVSENLNSTAEPTDGRHPTSDAFTGPSFISLADKIASSGQDNGSLSGAEESEKPLVTTFGNGGHNHRKEDEMEGYLGLSKDDDEIEGQTGLSNKDAAREQPLSSQGEPDEDDVGTRELPVSDNMSNDNLRGQSPFGQNMQPANNEQESWGKWTSDELNKGKDEVMSMTTGSAVPDERAAKEEPSFDSSLLQNDASETPVALFGKENVGSTKDADAKGNVINDAGTIDSLDAGEGKGFHDNEDNEDVEYYDPNNANDNQFQEGFSHGTGEDDDEAFNGTLAGSTIGKLQGLTGAVSTKLGLTNDTPSDPLNTESGEHDHVEEYRTEDAAASPEVASEKTVPTGIVQGLRNRAASTLSYMGGSSPKLPSNDENDTQEQPEAPIEDEQVRHSQQQSGGGAMQGLRNVLASKLGYGVVPESSPNEQTMYDESGEHANAVKAGHTSNEEREKLPSPQQTGGAFQGVKNAVASRLGYGVVDNAAEKTGEGPAAASSVEEHSAAGDSAPTPGTTVGYTQKLFGNAAAAARDYLSPKTGNGKEGRLVEDRNQNHPAEEKPTSVV